MPATPRTLRRDMTTPTAWTVVQPLVVTISRVSGGWMVCMTTNRDPPSAAEPPARRMRLESTVFTVLLLVRGVRRTGTALRAILIRGIGVGSDLGDGDQWQSQVAHSGQQAVQRSLVRDQTGDDGGAVGFGCQAEP